MGLMHRTLYLGVQLVRGRPVGRIIRRLRQWDRLDADSYRRLAEARLRAALLHAQRTVPLYGSGAWSRALTGADAADLERWPLLERHVLREEPERLVAASRRTLLLTRTSSASTGAPVRVKWNPTAVAWSWAAEYHPMLWHGLDIGVKTLRMWGGAGSAVRRAIENAVLNRHFVSAHELTPGALDEALRYVATERPPLIWGTPSAVLQLARWARQRDAVPAVAAGSCG